ncbi:MAG: hypothetical protein ACQES2_00055 [Pseudomonadota bacterium]
MRYYRLTTLLLLHWMLLWSATAAGESPETASDNKAESRQEVLFKTYDSDGNAVYSDQRPASGEEGVQVIDPGSLDGNVMEQRQDLQEYRRELLESAEERDRAEQKRAERIKEAEARVEEAKKALETGKEPRNDDWQRTVEQRRFLKPSYFDRVKRLEQEVESAKEALKKARNAPVTPE